MEKIIKSESFYTGMITELKPNEVYVFGANDRGLHGQGAAGNAMNQKRSTSQILALPNGTKEKWAIKGKTGFMEGNEGKSYGLITVEGQLGGKHKGNRIDDNTLIKNIQELYNHALNNPELIYKIAYNHLDKKSLNGFTGYELIELFNKAGEIPSNLQFSKEWFESGKLNIN